MKFNSQICTTREQSKRLLSLGLKKETADMVYEPHYINGVLKDYFEPKILEKKVLEYMLMDEAFKDYIPAWSLGRLIEMIPKNIIVNIHMVFPFRRTALADLIDNDCDLYEGLVQVIERGVKEGYFPKEYLV